MKKYVYAMALLMGLAQMGWAQSSLDNEVDAELDQMYANKPAAPTKTVVAQPTYIVNQGAPQQYAPVQKQPTTYIQDTPLVESAADQMKKNRQNTEVETENRIVLKLEQSRIEDEKRRAAILFGEQFNQLQNGTNANPNLQQAAQASQPQVAAPAPIQAQPIVIQTVAPEKENTRDVVREEIRAAMKAEEDVKVTPVQTRYFSAIAGIADFPDVKNARGNYSLGASYETRWDAAAVEGTFLFSNFEQDPVYYYGYYPNKIDIKQYSGQIAAKYYMFEGIIRPVVGGLIGYNYWDFSWKQNNSYAISNNNTANAQSIDLGVVTGADIALGTNFSLGVDFRYLWNMSSRRSDDSSFGYPLTGLNVEKAQRYVMSVSGRVSF